MSTQVLVTQNLSKRFGGVAALNNVNLAIAENEIRCVIGPNGAGKSTLFKVLCGLLKPDAGVVLLRGQNITRLPASRRVRQGLGLTFQTIRAFGQLSVSENMAIASGMAAGSETLELVQDIADLFAFDMRRGSLASELAHHELQWLEILMVLQNGSSICLFDEPTAGLAKQETEITANAIKRCQQYGLTVLVVEHDLKFIKQIADTVTVMHQGAIFFEGPLQSVLNNDDIKHIYLGR